MEKEHFKSDDNYNETLDVVIYEDGEVAVIIENEDVAVKFVLTKSQRARLADFLRGSK